MIIKNVEQGTDEWRKARLGVITGTRLQKLFGGTKYYQKINQENLINEMIAEVLTGEADILPVTADMARGSELEITALQRYAMVTEQTIDRVGMVFTDDGFCAVSPDGLVKANGIYLGACEVKCPKSKTMIKYIRDNQIPKEYKPQVLQYFHVIDTLDWLDFIVFDDRLNRLWTFRVIRKELDKELKEVSELISYFKEKFTSELNKFL